MTSKENFFQNQSTVFRFPKKGSGDLSPLPSPNPGSCAPVYSVARFDLVLSV